MPKDKSKFGEYFMNEYSKKLWIMTFISLIITLCAFTFLPKSIPIHFSEGAVNHYANRAWIFSFPFLQILLILISHIKSFKYWCMHYKAVPKTEAQYNMIIFCVILLISIVEIIIILLSLFLFYF